MIPPYDSLHQPNSSLNDQKLGNGQSKTAMTPKKVNLKCKASAFEHLPPHQLLERVDSSQGLEGCTGTGMGEQCSLSMPEQKHITVKVTMVVSLNEALQ